MADSLQLPRVGSLQARILRVLEQNPRWFLVDELFEKLNSEPDAPAQLTRNRVASALFGLRQRRYVATAVTGQYPKSPLVISAHSHALPREEHWRETPAAPKSPRLS